MLSLNILGLLILFTNVSCDQRLLIDQLRWDFFNMEDSLWNLSSNGLLYKSQEESELYLVKQFYDFDQKLKQMPENILRGVESLRSIPDFLFFYSELKVIENKYEKFREYQMAQISKSKNKVMMEDIIYDISDKKTGVKKTINYVHELVTKSIIVEMIKMVSDNFWCKNLEESPQQLFYNLYNIFGLNELKAYVMEQFAFLGSRLWDKGDHVDRSILARTSYEKRVAQTIKGFKNILASSPKDIWKCDPKNHVKDITYDEFTRLLQGHIQNEVDMSSGGTCKETCWEYSHTRSYGCYDYESEFCRKIPRCSGSLIDCRFIEAHASICLSTSPSRRYDFVKYDSGKTLGKQYKCSNQKTVNSWTRWFVRCHYCMCLCDEHGPKSDRYINLRPVKADIKKNRVVTGLRLVKHNRVLHIQIQEGKLLPYGYIDKSTVHWVPVDNYKITDPGVKNGEDFFTLTYEHRSMALDEIQVNQDNYVVTGARFEMIRDFVHFEIYVNKFHWQNGTIKENGGYYIYETNPNGRSKIPLSNCDVPILTNKPSEMHLSGTKSYVQFRETDFNKDAAQTTIPFIDIQEVVNKPAVPLMGAGIYYKGVPGYGGFIAPRIKTYDYEKHMSTLVPKIEIRKDLPDEFSVEVN